MKKIDDDNSTRLLSLLAGESAGTGSRSKVPFILPGALISAPPLEALIGIGLDPAEYTSVYDDPEKLARLSLYIQNKTRASNLALPCVMRVESEAYGGERDVRAGEGEVGEPGSNAIFEYPLMELSDYHSLKALDPDNDGQMPVVLEAMRLLKKARPDLPLIGDIVGPLSLATSLIDGATILRAMQSDGALLGELLDFLTENTIAFARAQLRSGAEVLFMIDPFSTAEVIGPEFYNHFTLPYIDRISQALDAEGAPLIVHICGNASPLASVLVGLECACLSLHSPEGGREVFGDKLLAGGLSRSLLLPTDKGESETASTASSAGFAAPGGFSIIAPSCTMDSSISLDAVRAAAASAVKVRK